jgi:hypothetical protein
MINLPPPPFPPSHTFQSSLDWSEIKYVLIISDEKSPLCGEVLTFTREEDFQSAKVSALTECKSLLEYVFDHE